MDTASNTTNTVYNLGTNYCAHRLPCGYCQLRGMMCTSALSFNPCKPWWEQVYYTTNTGTITSNNINNGDTTAHCDCKKGSCQSQV